MKRVLMAAAAASLFASPAAFAADSQTTNITIEGTVANTCVMGTPGFLGTNASQTALAGNAGTSAVEITSLAVSADDAALAAVEFTLTYSDSYCNYAHSVDLNSANGGLVDATPIDVVAGSGDFVRRIGYDSTLTWADGAAIVSDVDPTTSTAQATGTAIDGTAAPVSGAFRGDLVLGVVIASNPNPVVAGTYNETLTVTMGPTA